MFEIIPPSERKYVQLAFRYLKDDDLNNAMGIFKHITSGKFSEEAKYFGNYGLGVAYTKRTRRAGFTDIRPIDLSIEHLRKSTGKIDYADAHLMLGNALKDKIHFVSAKEVTTNEKDKRLLVMIDEAIGEFKRAARLNNNFASQSEQEISYLEREKRGLEERIRKKDY